MFWVAGTSGKQPHGVENLPRPFVGNRGYDPFFVDGRRRIQQNLGQAQCCHRGRIPLRQLLEGRQDFFQVGIRLGQSFQIEDVLWGNRLVTRQSAEQLNAHIGQEEIDVLNAGLQALEGRIKSVRGYDQHFLQPGIKAVTGQRTKFTQGLTQFLTRSGAFGQPDHQSRSR
ncbi:hypothetical protein HRbin36_01096 [bacterium HR36]|nr:hypothetical protein HRbin36_01096 [bacterium HR36]